jgi:molybdate transport system substrate-binding protein
MFQPRRLSRRVKACLLLAVIVTSGCKDTAILTKNATKRHDPLRIAAASDLQTVLPKLVEGFVAANPGAQVEVVFGSSGRLAEQIKAGGPWDLFLSANEKYVKDLAKQGRIDSASVRPYAIGALVLAVHRESGATLATLEDAARPEVKKIAIANPDVAPYGLAAKQALQHAGLWGKVQPKLVLAESVRQALVFVETGNAEAGLVSRATAGGSEVRLIDVDPNLHDPIVQSLGIVPDARGAPLAKRFIAFLGTDSGRLILESHGFKIPDASPVAASP